MIQIYWLSVNTQTIFIKTFIGADINKKFRNSAFGFGFNEDEIGYENNLPGIIKDSIIISR